MFEQERRDQGHALNSAHEHITFTPTTHPPAKWREFLECRPCKRSIIEAITLAYMQSDLTRKLSLLDHILYTSTLAVSLGTTFYQRQLLNMLVQQKKLISESGDMLNRQLQPKF